MDEIIYEALCRYYHALESTGYMPGSRTNKLLLLTFYRDFMFQDYRGMLSKQDYLLIERALDCIYGSNCLIPYPDYEKMGKLHLGEITELANRVQVLEDTNVLKLMGTEGSTSDSDIIIQAEADI